MKKYPDACEGCAVKGRACSHYNKEGTCPCVMCIIKPMCDRSCEKFDNWDRPDEPDF